MTDSMPERAILIAGGGIGGLAAALALAQCGRHVHVLERRDTFSQAGAGIQIGPNGVHALRKLGLADQLAAVAAQPDYIAIVNGATGEAIAQLQLGESIAQQHGAPYLVAHRADLHGILLAAAQNTSGIEISTNFEVSELTQNDDTVTVTASDGRVVASDLLIGADGQSSDVRTLLGISARITFAGKTAARTTVDVNHLPAPFT